jgi:hypothetical protein
MNITKLAAGLAIAAFAAGIIMNLQDIRRYIRIRNM